MRCEFHASIAGIPAECWDGLFDSSNPFVSHGFLLALERSGCVTPETGWHPMHALVTEGGKPVAAMPLYAKTHSYGEFVFDWGWAEAYQRHGLPYYPKLLTSVPFSPVAGPRVGVSPERAGEVVPALVQAVHEHAARNGFSSWHVLFPGDRLRKMLLEVHGDSAFLQREAVQFHWFNKGYDSFADFLGTLRSSRRKNLNRERARVAEQGITLERKAGHAITDEEWSGFFRCYRDTYRKRSGHDGYLNRAFFDQLRHSLEPNLLLVVARDSQDIVGTSLFLHDDQRLYGRYWGALKEVSCLHFEACFYQGIEFCIERGLAEFDPGTQGEHKLLRGFEPIKSASFHWIANPAFRVAIEDFLRHERRDAEGYRQSAETFLPYKRA